MKIGYLVNVYPKVSHAFIRREIAALSTLGASIQRYSIRRSDEPLVDPADVAEEALTTVLLDRKLSLLLSAASLALRHPINFVRGLAAAWSFSGRGAPGLVKHLIYLLEAARLASLCSSDGVTHLHAHFGTNPATVALLCRAIGGPPFSFTVHGPDEFDAPLALRLREKVAAAAFTVAISSFTRSQLMRWSDPRDWDRIHVVRCGVDRSFLGAADSAPPAGNTFLCIGRLAPQKGHHVLLQALALLKGRGHLPSLALIGDGPLRHELEELTHRLDLQSQVTFHGNQTSAQIRQHILSCRATVLPSFAEGLPVVLMESLALGRPAITTYVAGIPELIQNGENGWLIPAGNADALSDAITSCMNASPCSLRDFASAAQSAVQHSHNVDLEADRLLAMFVCVTAQRQQTPIRSVNCPTSLDTFGSAI